MTSQPRGSARAALLTVGVCLLSACAPTAGDTAASPAPSVPAPPQTSSAPVPTTPAAATPSSAPQQAEPVPVELSVLAGGLVAPWGVAFGDGRVFVTERDSGRVLEVSGGQAREVAVLPVDNAGEAGLLGIAASPAFARDGQLFVYATMKGQNQVLRLPADGGGAPVPILAGIPAGRIHDGGRLAFGPDGHLYVGTGDSGTAALAQDPGSLAGKVLRIAPDGSVPADNPFPGSPVWTLGHRNVQGLAWGPDGTLYATEFGPDRDDEINVLRPGGNYGWPEVTGAVGDPRFVDPVVVRQPPEASWSGAVVLQDGAIPQWEGDLFASALRGGQLWRFPLGEDGTVLADQAEALLGDQGRLRHVAQAPDGSLWVLTNNTDGRGRPGLDDDRILRLGPPAS